MTERDGGTITHSTDNADQKFRELVEKKRRRERVEKVVAWCLILAGLGFFVLVKFGG